MCGHRMIDQLGNHVRPGEEGELIVSGAGIMVGYWNLPNQNAAAFLQDQDGRAWYRTGDLVTQDRTEGYSFHGLRNRIVRRPSPREHRKLSLIRLKQFSIDNLPRYMAPDMFAFLETLPRTSTDKIDYQNLRQQG